MKKSAVFGSDSVQTAQIAAVRDWLVGVKEGLRWVWCSAKNLSQGADHVAEGKKQPTERFFLKENKVFVFSGTENNWDCG